MPQTILTFNNQRLQPALFPEDARRSSGKFGASKVFPTGAVIGRKTSDGLLYPCVSVNAAQLATITTAATAGTFTISVQKVNGTIGTTTALAYSASVATIQTALDIASGVVNGIVVTSAGSAAPFSTPANMTLTYSGTGFSALEQPLFTVNWSGLTGTTAVAITNVQPNVVQTVTLNIAATAGGFVIGILRPTGVMGYTGVVAFNATLATLQTALDLASGTANGVVAASAASAAPFSSAAAFTLTYSGTGFASLPQALAVVEIGADVTGTTRVTVDDTTLTRDGTDVPVGFVEFGFNTDANSNCFLTTGTAAADLSVVPQPTMPFFIAGTFNIQDLPGWRDGMLAKLFGRYQNTNIIRIP